MEAQSLLPILPNRPTISVTLPLSDADVERLLKEAVDLHSTEERDGLLYLPNESEPYSGWAKGMYDSGQVKGLGQAKDGKPDGLQTAWHENGQKMREGTYKDGKPDGLWTQWHDHAGAKRGDRPLAPGGQTRPGHAEQPTHLDPAPLQLCEATKLPAEGGSSVACLTGPSINFQLKTD